MSYFVEIIRPIRVAELLTIIENDITLSILDQGENWIVFSWADNEEQSEFDYSQGRISITSPTDSAWAKAEELASILNATVIEEEEQLSKYRKTDGDILKGRSTWIGWPILVVILAVALFWRW
jgi:hypothetical protein